MTDEEYQSAYQAGYEDGKAAADVWTRGPFVIVYIRPEEPDHFKLSWKNLKDSDEGATLLRGLECVAEEIEEMMDSSQVDDDDDDE